MVARLQAAENFLGPGDIIRVINRQFINADGADVHGREALTVAKPAVSDVVQAAIQRAQGIGIIEHMPGAFRVLVNRTGKGGHSDAIDIQPVTVGFAPDF